MVDCRRIVITDTEGVWVDEWKHPEEKEEKGMRLSVFLQEDLVSYDKEAWFVPGKSIKVVGILRDIPLLHDFGGIYTRYDWALEAINIWPIKD